MEKDPKKSDLERINELEHIVHEMVHVPRGMHNDHIFNRRDVYHHGFQEIRVMDYVTRHAYSLPQRFIARMELGYFWYKELIDELKG